MRGFFRRGPLTMKRKVLKGERSPSRRKPASQLKGRRACFWAAVQEKKSGK